MRRLSTPTLLAGLCGVLLAGSASAQCTDGILIDGGFEDGLNGAWFDWNDNSPDSYSFGLSNDAHTGDSSAVINVLTSTAVIPGGQGGEFNSRPQTNPVIGGQYYDINFWAKSTAEATEVIVYVKDENDGWPQLHREVVTVGTDWTNVSSVFQADEDRADIHIEIKVYNAEFTAPYSVFLDDIAVCNVEILTNTCEGNLVPNPGFEEGISTNWGSYDGGTAGDYSFEAATTGAVGNASAQINVLKPGSELSGAGEFNNRPAVMPAAGGQNYKVSVMGRSTLANAVVQAWVKDEYDGWTTLGNADLVFGEEWSEQSFVFANDFDRDDVHIELKAANPDATAPYQIYLDEVSMCATDEEPGTGEPDAPDPVSYGSTTDIATCQTNVLELVTATDEPNDGIGWDIWDGSEDEVAATFALDPVLPYEGDDAVRISVNQGNDIAEFHHRFGTKLNLVAGQEYTVSMWLRTDAPAGDSVRIYTRGVRDTDWSSQFAVNFIVTKDEWSNYFYTFTADGDWDNAFLEMKVYRQTEFDAEYSVWIDEISFCTDAEITVGVEDLAAQGIAMTVAPNPVVGGAPLQVVINAEKQLARTNIQLVDMLGRTVDRQVLDIATGEQRISFPTDQLSSGMYFIRMQQGGRASHLKVQVVNR